MSESWITAVLLQLKIVLDVENKLNELFWQVLAFLFTLKDFFNLN